MIDFRVTEKEMRKAKLSRPETMNVLFSYGKWSF